MAYYAVIDTNVVISAFLKANSIPSVLISLIFSKTIIPLLNDEIVAEYEDVLNRDKFSFDKEQISIFLIRLKELGFFIGKEHSDEHFPDPDDKVFYEIVSEKRKTDEAYLVTENIKHFPNKSFIVTPKEMLEIISSGGEEIQ